MNLKQYFTAKFLFDINRVMLETTDKVFFAIGLALVVLSAVFKLAAVYAPTPVDRKYREKFFHLLLSIGLAETVWFGARYYFVRFFGSHFVALLILLIGLVWMVFAAKGAVKNYKAEKIAWEKERVKQKYLPNSGK